MVRTKNFNIKNIYVYVANWSKILLQIGAALFSYKLGLTMLQIDPAQSSQVGVAQFLQIVATLNTKLRYVLQIRSIMANNFSIY